MNCPYYTAIVQYFSMGNHTNQHFSFLSAAAHHNRDIYIQRSARHRKGSGLLSYFLRLLYLIPSMGMILQQKEQNKNDHAPGKQDPRKGFPRFC